MSQTWKYQGKITLALLLLFSTCIELIRINNKTDIMEERKGTEIISVSGTKLKNKGY